MKEKHKHGVISIPSISGSFITLFELSNIVGIKYATLFHYQKSISLLPKFRIAGIKNIRYKKKESIYFLDVFKKLRADKAKERTDFLQDIKAEMWEIEEYRLFWQLAENHAQEMREQNRLSDEK